MLSVAGIVGIGLNTGRTRSAPKAAALLLAGMALSTPGSAYAAAFSNQDKDAQPTQKAQAKDAPDPVTMALKAAVRNGSMSEERAMETYALLTTGLRGSKKQADTRDYLEKTAAKLDALVETGDLSAEDADAKLIAIETQIAAKAEFASRFDDELASRMQTAGKSKTEAYLELVAERLDEIVLTGELSAEDAQARLIALEVRIAVNEQLASKMENEGKSKTEAYLELVAAKLEELVKAGKLSAADAEARMTALENSIAGKSKPGSLDARTVLRAAKRVDLNRDQQDELRDIEQITIAVYRKISRKDKQRHTELAEQVKAEITKLLDARQIDQFEAALKRLDRDSRRAERKQRRQSGPKREPKPREP